MSVSKIGVSLICLAPSAAEPPAELVEQQVDILVVL
jgi:hypothetical protein